MSRKRIYRSDLFSTEQLTSRDALESAVEELQSILKKDNFKYVLQELIDNEIPRTLVLVLSSLGETTSLFSWLLESFPAEATNYEATIHYKVISCLSTELISSDLVEEKDLCARYHKIADVTPKVLQYLVSFLHPIGIKSEHHYRKGKAKQSRRKPREVKRAGGVTTSVKKYFDVLNVDMPETSGEASTLVDRVLKSQKETLKFYLELLCRPGISLSLKEHCIVSAFPTEDGKHASGSAVEPFVYPIVQPMMSYVLAALYFDTAEGFGEWTVVISTNADNLLRRAHKKNLTAFNAIVEKIKELSCGHFTDNNQKRLSGSATEVPVFEAKVSRSLRLVYQIDIIPGDDNEQQAFFPPLPEVLSSEIEYLPDIRPDKTAQIHSRPVSVEKYVTFSQPFLNTILADVDAIFPHMVSCATASTLLVHLLTTCIHRTQQKRIVEHPKSCYVIGRSGTGKRTIILFKMLLIERTFQVMESGLPHPRQVFIAKSRMLAMKVQGYFAKLESSLAVESQLSVDPTNLMRAPQHQADLRPFDLVDVDDVVDWRTDLPRKYSELEPKHFPLFITFDGLCDMLEADMGAQMSTTTSPISSKHMGVITFESFCESYWPHFPASLVKGLDPAFVFSEMIGVIKGSTETLREENRHLSKAAYLDLFKRQQSSTFAEQRCKVYKLFELYMHKKKLRGEYDAGDRTHSILKYFTEHGTPHQGLDHLYVDEVQDHMLIDTMVLRALCSNANGLLWAGDPAQTISVGSSFSFNALKTFQWNIEDQYRRKHSLAAQQPPETFQLTVNYRSHTGVVDCANSIIDLITMFWEDSIDRLSPEMGIVDGVKPVFFNNEDRAQLKRFIFGGHGKPIEFGTQQCIIVRNEAAREKLQQQVGEVGLVLTVYESKGLEFNDVLLYNFFADSSAGLTQWRVVLNAVEESKQDPRNPPPQFDHIRHASICNELKSLYAAITRAHENIWIADESEAGEPMRTFWTSKDLIQNYTPGSNAPRLAFSLTPEELASKGRELFYRKQFSHAKHCYIRANLPILASIAGAYDLRAKARKAVGTSRPKVLERCSCFTEAAISFSECADITSNSKDSLTYFRISGECFEQADQKYQAAQMFFRAQEYTHTAELYRDLGNFDEAVAIVKDHEDEMSLKVVENVIKLARLTYLSNRQMKEAHQLFDSLEEELEYLEERALDIALADLLETMGRLSEAAELHYSEGRREEAIELFLREAKNKNALRHPVVLRLMGFASQLDTTFMERTKAAELSMFTAILQDQASRLRELALEFHKMGHSSAALLCLDQYYARAFRIQDMALVDAVEELNLFYIYVNLLSTAAYRIDPCQDMSTATLQLFKAHVPASVVDAEYYNMRVRLHLQQILILQSFGENSEFWLNRLYEAVYPPHHVFGSISDLDLSTIPEAARAVNVVKDWVTTLTYRRAFYPNTTSRMDVMRATTLALIFDQSQADYLGNVAYPNACTPPMYIRRGGSSILLGPLAAMSGTYPRLSDEETVRWEEEFVDETDGIVDVIPLRDMTFTAPEPTEREIAAAFLIQRVYRKVLRRRRVTAKRGKQPCTLKYTPRAPKKYPGSSVSRHHNEYDVLDDQLIQTTKAYKAAVKLQQQLDPSSMFHERCDSKELRKLVEEATGLVSSLPFRTSLNLSDDLHLAHKGILAERSPAGKLKKPTLKIRR
ncbi:hypothetical protein EV421DRAFT_1905200 [Armillaria borealis]|uniref:UvrD-like helicase ATP-binding domain-containing protein n=1 Tax=Armillaria borealis TaxID=47425 RepID=A0AA39MNI1_9AGAR|nr:hypothetical protein EV421DRAFT_1905200 [Armillaria borealis]